MALSQVTSLPLHVYSTSWIGVIVFFVVTVVMHSCDTVILLHCNHVINCLVVLMLPMVGTSSLRRRRELNFNLNQIEGTLPLSLSLITSLTCVPL